MKISVPSDTFLLPRLSTAPEEPLGANADKKTRKERMSLDINIETGFSHLYIRMS